MGWGAISGGRAQVDAVTHMRRLEEDMELEEARK